MTSLLMEVVSASWPKSCEDWCSLQIDHSRPQRSVWNDEPQETQVCYCMFRAEPCNDAGTDTRPGEELRVRISLDTSLLAARLLESTDRPDNSPWQPPRCVEFRATPWPRMRRKKTVMGVNEEFHLLDNRDDPAAEQPPHFLRWPLRKEQLRSLRWMQRREHGSEPFDLITGNLQADPGGGSLSQVGVSPSPNEGLLGYRWEFRCREMYNIHGGILGDAVGYGKTATTIGLIDSGTCRFNRPEIPEAARPYFFDSGATLILVPSNLLDQWVSEMRKFLGTDEHHGDGTGASAPNCAGLPLRIVPVRTAAQLKALTVQQLCKEADVVLCSYRLFYSPVYRRRLLQFSGLPEVEISKMSDAQAARMPVNIMNLRRNTRMFRENPIQVGWKQRMESLKQLTESTSEGGIVEDPCKLRFPVLEQFWWNRVVFDEFHELEAMGNSAQFESLKDLCSRCRWGLTGTPPTRDLDQIQTLARLFQIQDMPRVKADSELAYTMAQRFLDHFARQNTSEELPPIELKEHIIDVYQTPDERAIYLQALHDVTARSNENDDDTSRATGPSVAGTELLLKLCSHFAGGAGGSTDARAECRRILETKQKAVERATSHLASAMAAVELLTGSITVAESISHSSAPTSRVELPEETAPPLLRDVVLSKLQDKFGCCKAEKVAVETGDIETFDAAPAGAESSANVAPKPQGSDGETASAHGEASTGLEGDRNGVASETYDSALAALEQARGLTRPELLRKAKSATHNTELAPHVDSYSVQGDTKRVRQKACEMVLSAAAACDSSTKSKRFFERALSAARGEAPAEQRSCSVCLDEDIPVEQLSITLCAHVFHTECILEVAKKLGNCPHCRHKLDPQKDITCLSLELAAAEKKSQSDRGRQSRWWSPAWKICCRQEYDQGQGK